MPSEVSRFCTFHLDYGEKLEAAVTFLKLWQSTLVQCGLGISLKLEVTQLNAFNWTIVKMKH